MAANWSFPVHYCVVLLLHLALCVMRASAVVDPRWFLPSPAVPAANQAFHMKRVRDFSNDVLSIPPTIDSVTGLTITGAFKEPEMRNTTYDVYYVPNAHLMSQAGVVHQGGVVYVRDGQNNAMPQLITARHMEANGLHHEAYIASHPAERLSGPVLYFQNGCHYWHIHHECIAQLLIYRMAGVFEDYLPGNLTILARSDCDTEDALSKEILAYFGFNLAEQGYNIVAMKPETLYQAELLIHAPSFRFGAPSAYSPQFFNEFVRAHTKRLPYAPRIFIDREEGYSRRIKNKPALLEVLAKYNISLYSPLAHKSYVAQREIFASAELVISAEGTGFSMNACFCDPNTTIMIELFGNHSVYHTIHTKTGIAVMRLLGFKHYFPLSPSYDVDPGTGDFSVDVARIDTLLARLDRQKQAQESKRHLRVAVV